MQKICFFFSLLMAKTIPQDMAAGRAGGTVTVIRSKALSTRISTGTPISTCNGMVEIVASRARIAIIPTNFKPSE